MKNYDPLWFDVEIGYKTTQAGEIAVTEELWFDVEIGYKTTNFLNKSSGMLLWFDVEIGYKTTLVRSVLMKLCCGLM